MTDPPTEDPAFAALLDRARAGDEFALEGLLEATNDRLRRSVDKRLGAKLRGSLRRSDVLQNAFLAMLDALPGFRGATREEFVAWVSQIVENDIRRQNRWFGAKKRKAPSRTSQRNALARILLESPPTPSAEMARGEQQELVRAALERLDPDYARVIELSVFEELPHSEIAQRLGRSEGACRMLLRRARTALALELEHMADERD